jgi:tetratricopeptide (TPR) repeat protein
MHTSLVGLKGLRNINLTLYVIVLVTLPISVPAFANQQQINSKEGVVDRAKAVWLDGAPNRALEILDQELRDDPPDLQILKLRGDIFATSRRDQEAIQAYDAVLQRAPAAIDVRWAKWSVLVRSGQGDEAIAELQRIAQYDSDNPLVHMLLAQELRKLDRLEESLASYQKAVELAPELPAWRLALARARFDVMDGPGARDEIQDVLKMVPPGSPEDAAARNLMSVVYGATKERGRRFEWVFSPDGTAATRKEWATIRADAWRLFEAGRYEEAEPLLRRVLELKPSDFGAEHDLGVTLMELDRCEEAIPILEKVLEMTTKDEPLADTYFQIGVCKTKLGKWSEALDHFEILYEAAVDFEERTKGVWVAPGIRVLNTQILREWKDKARQHIPPEELQRRDEMKEALAADPGKAARSEEEYYAKLAKEPMKTEDWMETRAALMGRDADFSMFRYVIPAPQVMRDDLPTGAHEFIPVEPNDTFPTNQEEIFLVFGLVTASFDEVSLTAKCFPETAKMAQDQRAVASDQVAMAMNEQTGYFILSAPEAGWTPGLYRCGLFVGDEVSAYTHADEIRFRILESPVHLDAHGRAGSDETA